MKTYEYERISYYVYCKEDGQSFYSEAFEMISQVLDLLKIRMDVREKNMLVDGFEQECLAQLNSGDKGVVPLEHLENWIFDYLNHLQRSQAYNS